MKTKRYCNQGKVCCDSCGNYHFQWWMVSSAKKLSKKIGCATGVNVKNNEYEFFCYYGSGYDTNVYKLINPLSFSKRRHTHAIERIITKFKADPEVVICDKCVARFIKKKYIKLISSGFNMSLLRSQLNDTIRTKSDSKILSRDLLF